jgi:hypothetical protein
MIEILKHAIGVCGDHWHPNIWHAMASTPIFLSAIYYVKCKCGGFFKHTKNCTDGRNTKN